MGDWRCELRTVGLPWQKYGRGYVRHEQRTREAIPSDQTDDFFALQRGLILIALSVLLLPLISSFFFACLNTLGTWCQMIFSYLAPRLKSFIFQVLRWNLPRMLPLVLLKGKQLILGSRLTVPSLTTVVNQTTMFLHRWQIPLNLLPLPPPGWVNYSKKWVQKKQDIMGHLHFWKAKKSSTIPS